MQYQKIRFPSYLRNPFCVHRLKMVDKETLRIKVHALECHRCFCLHHRLDVAVRDGQSSWSTNRSSRAFLNDHRSPRISLIDFNLAKRSLRLKVEDDDHTVAVSCGNQENRVELIPSDGVADGTVEQFTLPQRDWVEGLVIKRCEAVDASGNRSGIDLRLSGKR